MNNVLLWIGGVLVVVLCALFAVPHFVNWNLYRGAFEEEASRLLSRDVRVAGGVTVRALPVPYVVFEKVRVGDVVPKEGPQIVSSPLQIAGSEPVLRIERFTMGLSITALLRGTVSASEVELVRPEVRARLGTQGANLMALLAPMTTAGRGSAFAVDAVRLTGGSLTLVGQDGGETLSATDITGDLTDPGGSGSPRFRGTATYQGEPRDVRISTAALGPGAFKVKAQARTLSSATVYGFDGEVSGLATTLGYEGQITAKLPIGSLGGEPAAQTPGAGPSAVPAADTFELKAQAKGTATALAIEDVTLAFERDGQSQVINGTARATWAEGVEASAQLSSRLLDLDRVFAASGGARPVGVVGWLVKTITDAMPRDTRLALTLDVDSVTLAGEQVSEVELALAGANGLVMVEKAAGRLPGGGTVQLTGRSSDDRRSFRGTVQVRTGSVRRLLGWVTTGMNVTLPRVDGPLVMEAAVTAGVSGISFDQATGEIGGQAVRGGVSFDWTTRPRVRFALDAPRLAVGSLLPDLVSAEGVRAFIGTQPSASGNAKPPHEVARLFSPQDVDLALALRIGELDDGTERLSDVVIDLASTRADLKIDRLSATTRDGLALDLRGRVAQAAGDARGSLTADIVAERAPGVERLARLFGVLDGVAVTEFASIAPLRLSAKVTLGEDGTKRDRVVIDGAAGASRVYGNGTFELGLSRWADARSDLHGAFVGPEATAAARLFAPAGAIRAGTGRSEDGRIVIRLAGIARKSMHALAALKIAGTDAAFDGRVEIPAGQGYRAAGRLAVTTADARDLMAWAGLTTLGAGSQAPVSGTLEVDRAATKTSVRFSGLTVAGTTLGGTVAIARESAGARIDADLMADRLTAASLLQPFMHPASASAERAGGRGTASDAIWSDQPFSLDALGAQQGQIAIKVRELVLGTDHVLPDARVVVRLGPGGLEIGELSGRPAGGEVSARFTLAPRKSDAEITGAITLDGIDLARLGGASTGTFGATLEVKGQGASPLGLIKGLTGTGTARLVNVIAAGIEPRVAEVAFEQAASSDPQAENADLSTLIADIVAAGRVPVASREARLQLSGGALKISDIRIETPTAVIENRSTVDLATLRADLDWRVTPTPRDGAGTRARPLPAIGVVYAGPLVRLGKLLPRIEADDLQRELTVRRLERNVQELERLRREDEDRARQEGDRRRRIEDEQAAAAAILAAQRAADAARQAADAAARTPPPALAGPPPQVVVPQQPAPGTGPASPSTGVPGAPAAADDPALVAPAPQPVQRRSQPTSAPIRDPLLPR